MKINVVKETDKIILFVGSEAYSLKIWNQGVGETPLHLPRGGENRSLPSGRLGWGLVYAGRTEAGRKTQCTWNICQGRT